MTTVGPERTSHHLLTGYFEAGASLSTLTTHYPQAADACRTKACNFTHDAATEDRVDAQGTLSKLDDAIAMQRKGAGSWEGYLIPSGTIGTAPDIAVHLTSGGWRAVTGTNTTVSGTSSTTTRIDVASSSGWSVGSACLVTLPSGAIEARIVGAVDSVGTDLVVTPALSETPNVNGANVKAGVAYWPKDARHDSQDCLTGWASVNRLLKRGIGYTPDKFSIQLAGNRVANLSHSGPCRQVDFIGQTTMNDSGGISNVDTTMTVSDPDVIPDDVATNNVDIVIIDSSNGDEVVKVTAKSGSDLTIVRAQQSTSAVTHADGLTIVPYEPTGTHAGSPVPASTASGAIIIGGVSQNLSTVDIDCSFPLSQIENVHGSAYSYHAYACERREVGWSVAGWSDSTTMALVMDAIRRGSPEVFVSQGNTEGAIVGAYSPSVLFRVPESDPSGSPTMALSLEGPARGSSAQDEFCLFFC